MFFSFVLIVYVCVAGMSMLYKKKHIVLHLLQESFGHWSQGLKASMQDPKMQVAIVKRDF